MALSLSRFTNAIKNNYGKYLAKAAGAAAVGMVAYDAHILGKLNADIYADSKEAKRCSAAFNNTLYQTEPSLVQSKIKKKLFNWELENNIFRIWNSAMGYLSGLGQMLVSGVVPLGLGLTALLTPLKHGKICKGAGIALLAYGAVKTVRDIFGLGQKNPLNSRYK